MAEKKNMLFLVIFSLAVLVALASVFGYFLTAAYLQGKTVLGRAVAVVDIVGEITYDQRLAGKLAAYRDDNHVAAVVLHLNSPGGGAAASQELYHQVEKLKRKKPVVACLGEVAASGAYYVACAADSIVAKEGTVTGSIGVLAAFIDAKELLRKVGIGITVVKAGKFKDMGSPHRPMSEEEKRYLARMLDRVYNQFIDAVSTNRGLERSKVIELAQGKIYCGEEAWELGLVDTLGTLEDAVLLAARMAGIEGKPRVIRRRRKRRLIDLILGTSSKGQMTMGRGLEIKYVLP